ncbi:BgTH12-01224 [Blumeria graminis f. sp. triticale]|uniref:Bgt-5175 n=3 Tax=Blumeria graminis TaxID=34373 RepID=A0A061HKR9_BLUGR|nr:hypothetical protein BGT96224_5175 [Blumeria graminis f. sp. tritici 96224]CAD6505737.1 BgTH12-01224 [Blumeria graminis f. sp. triticale]VDB93906.1 Bgt-5175 [Blumeria graminis f. sp. tritici]
MMKRIFDTVLRSSSNKKLSLQTKKCTGTSTCLDTLDANKYISEASLPISETDSQMITFLENPKYQELDRHSYWCENKSNENEKSERILHRLRIQDEKSSTSSEAKHNISPNKKSLQKQLRIDTINIDRQSQGWWSILTSPFLSHPMDLANFEKDYYESHASECSRPSVIEFDFVEGPSAKLCGIQKNKFSNKNSPLGIASTSNSNAIYSSPVPTRAPTGVSPKQIGDRQPAREHNFDLNGVPTVKQMPSQILGLNDSIQSLNQDSCTSSIPLGSSKYSFHIYGSNSSPRSNSSHLQVSQAVFNSPHKKSMSPRAFSPPDLPDVLLEPPKQSYHGVIPKDLSLPKTSTERSSHRDYPKKLYNAAIEEPRRFKLKLRRCQTKTPILSSPKKCRQCHNLWQMGFPPRNLRPKTKRTIFFISIFFTLLIIIASVLAAMNHRKPRLVPTLSSWLNLTDYPPLFLGVSTIISPNIIKEDSGCVFPSTQWSCHLPKELHVTIEPNPSNQPNFVVEIQWDNSTLIKHSFSNLLLKRIGAHIIKECLMPCGKFIRHSLRRALHVTASAPAPTPPMISEMWFLGNTTDGILSEEKAGELTPFYISFYKPKNLAMEILQAVSGETNFQNTSFLIPALSLSSDGTAAPANLLPFPTLQPLRLFDRGLLTEHYGFYTYFDRSIFLKSLDTRDKSYYDPSLALNDIEGGARKSEASFRCTWSQTRFLVQIWTRRNTARIKNISHSENFVESFGVQQPTIFPYPTTVTIDRHGGDPFAKTVYCYRIDQRRIPIESSGQISIEDRRSGGNIINPAPTIFTNDSNPRAGGFDGGTSGCSCQWENF